MPEGAMTSLLYVTHRPIAIFWLAIVIDVT